MVSHPSRGWQRRAEQAAAGIVARLAWHPGAEVQCFTRADLEALVRRIALDAYAAGRLDGKPPQGPI